jgi:Ca-activated chloride channel homolog
MKNTLFICAAFVAIAPSIGWCADAPRQSMKDGLRFYESKTYDSAAGAFERAAQSAQQDKLDASVAKYNAANALYRMGQFGAASTNFADATRSPNLALQSKAYYNRGNALVSGSEKLEKQGGADSALGSMDEAIEMYENAMTLSPSDEDAKVNYELALKKKQELQQKKQQQQQQQKQDQDKKDQQQKDQSQQQDQQKKDEQQKQDQQKNQPQNQQKDEGQPQPQQQREDQQKQAQPQKSEEMTPEEAKMMLDAMKQEEQASRDRMRLVIGQPTPVDKDW